MSELAHLGNRNVECASDLGEGGLPRNSVFPSQSVGRALRDTEQFGEFITRSEPPTGLLVMQELREGPVRRGQHQHSPVIQPPSVPGNPRQTYSSSQVVTRSTAERPVCLLLPDCASRITTMADERHAKGAVVHALRHAQGATLTDLAHRAGLSPGYLSRVERGERAPSWYATVRLASALDTVPAVLTGLLPPLRQLRRAMFGGEHSLVDFAALAGVDSDRLLEYESGSTSLDTKELTRLASVLRVDLDVFHSSRRSGVQLPD